MRDHQRTIEVAANALRAESDPRERFDALPSLVGLEALSHLDVQRRFNGQMALSFAAVALAGGGLLVPALADIGPAALAWAVVAALFALAAFAVARAVAGGARCARVAFWRLTSSSGACRGRTPRRASPRQWPVTLRRASRDASMRGRHDDLR